MLVRMLALAAGPTGVWYPGQEIELPAEQAMALVNGHYAVLIGGNDGRYTAAVGGAIVETAMLAPAEPVVVPMAELRLKFGKHKGESIAEIYATDSKYVTDFLSHNNDPDIVAAVKAFIR